MRSRDRRARAFITAVAVSGILMNAAYAVENGRGVLDPGLTVPVRQALMTAVAFEVGWVALLLWFLRDPAGRRGVLLLSVPPILLASAGHNVLGGANGRDVVAGLAVSVAYSTLYVFAHDRAGPGTFR